MERRDYSNFLSHILYDVKLRSILMIVLLLGFGYCAVFQYSFFNISYINEDTILIFIVLFICSLFIFEKLKKLSELILKKTNNL
mgnify:CR=1 FL=1